MKVERVDMKFQGSGRGGRSNYDLKLLYEILSKLIKVFYKGNIYLSILIKLLSIFLSNALF